MAGIGRSARTRKDEYVEWSQLPFLSTISAGTKIARLREITKQQDALEKERKELAVELESALIVDGVKAARHGELLLVRCSGGTASKVSKEKLLLHGVDPGIVLECVEPGTKYTYVQVKEEGEE